MCNLPVENEFYKLYDAFCMQFRSSDWNTLYYESIFGIELFLWENYETFDFPWYNNQARNTYMASEGNSIIKIITEKSV